MSEGLSALLGCVQSEVSQFDPSGKLKEHVRRLTHRVVLPTSPKGTQAVTLVCKHCEQKVHVRVRSRGAIRSRRLVTRLALAVSVFLWVAAAAFLLLYFLEQYPATPGREVALPGVLAILGVVVWAGVDAQDAFGGDVAIGCRIERTPAEQEWTRRLTPEARRALPRHVLLDPEHEFAAADLRGEIGRNLAVALRKPSASSAAASSGVTESAAPGSASRTA